jgi:membrane fusion protein (multidrug efflux system)
MKFIYWLSLISTLIACQSKDAPIKKQVNTVPVVLVKVEDVPIYNEFVGQTYGLKDIPIRTRVDGYIEKIDFEEGTNVTEGKLLYEIDPDPFLAEVAAKESNVAEAKTKMINALNELNRYKPLAEKKAVSESDLDAAQAKYDAAKSNVEAAEANLKQANIKLSYCSIKSPINGLIGKTEARVGEYVGKEPNPVILNTISRIDTIRVQFSISENKYLQLAKAYQKNKTSEQARKQTEEGKVKPNIELILGDGSIYDYKGKVDFINNQINSTTGSLLIQASFPNPNRLLRPGLYAKIRLQLGIEENAKIIPQRSLIELQGKYSVFIVNDSNKVEQRAVEVASKIGDLAIISEGIEAKDKVVIDALQQVAAGIEVKAEVIEFQSKTSDSE